MPPRAENRNRRISADAGLCVRCGLCLPHCPTYAKLRHEGDSPRGRIALAGGLAGGELPATRAVKEHLLGCLCCRRCEVVCPSGVPFGRLLDAARDRLVEERAVGPLGRVLRHLIAEGVPRHPIVQRAVAAGFRLAGPLLRSRAARLSQRLSRLAAYLPEPRPWRGESTHYPAASEEKGTVTLFLGCIARVTEGELLEASIRLLNRFGYSVRTPEGQGCCGALYLHYGEQERGVRLALRNLEALSGEDEPLLTCASGCGAILMEYADLPGLPEGTMAAAEALRSRVKDISAFLAGIEWPDGQQPRPLNRRVALHLPCSLDNVMGQSGGAHALLSRLPGIELVELPGNGTCCGGGGLGMLTHPELADALGSDKCDAVEEVGAELLVTSNSGCAMHLKASLRRRGMDVEVLHPVSLLARQLD